MTSDPTKLGHQNHLRGGRRSEPHVTYAITKCVEGRRKLLATDAAAAILMDCLDFLRSDGHLRLSAFCVMEDHLHVVLLLLDKKTLSQVMHSLGRFTAPRINRLSENTGQLWQDGFFDHRCRDVDDAIDRIEYVEQNPVRAGLTADAQSWPYSSAYPANARLLDRKWYAERC